MSPPVSHIFLLLFITILLFLLFMISITITMYLLAQGSCALCTQCARPSILFLMAPVSQIWQVLIQTQIYWPWQMTTALVRPIYLQNRIHTSQVRSALGGRRLTSRNLAAKGPTNAGAKQPNPQTQILPPIWKHSCKPDFQCLLPALISPMFGLTLNVVDQEVDIYYFLGAEKGWKWSKTSKKWPQEKFPSVHKSTFEVIICHGLSCNSLRKRGWRPTHTTIRSRWPSCHPGEGDHHSSCSCSDNRFGSKLILGVYCGGG